jgi:AsmA protein
VLAAGGLAALTVAAPVGLVRDELVRQVKAKTGRDLVIAGPTSLSFLPSIAVRMENVSLSAPPSMGGAPLATIAGIDANVQLWPLLQRRIELSRLVLKQPVFDLRVDANGRQSWSFAAADTPDRGPIRLAQASGPNAGKFAPQELKDFMRSANPGSREALASRGPLAALASIPDLALADVRIVDGTVRFSDARTGTREDVSAMTLDIAMANLAAPLSVRGALTWHKEPLRIDGRLGTLAALAADRPAALKASVSGKPITASYDGALRVPGNLELDGTVALKTASVRALAAWAGQSLPPGGALGPASVTGTLKLAETSVAISEGKYELDGATAAGTLSVEKGRERPLIKANLQVSELVFDRYLGGAVAPARAAPVAPPAQASPSLAPPPPPAARTGAPQSIEDLLKASPQPKAGPQVRGFSKSAGWNEDPIDLAALGLVDIDARIAAGRIVHRELLLGATRAHVWLSNRVFKATIDDVQLYDGRGRGVITLDGTGTSATIGANLSADGVAALPLLKSASGFDWVSGRGRIALAVAGRGQTERQIVETLTGRVDLALADGALIGYDVGAILGGLQKGRLRGLDRVQTEKTDFKELAGTFLIANGIAQNNDLRLNSPHVTLTGTGKIDLVRRALDYVTRPKLAVAAQIPGGIGLDFSKVDIPVKIAGPWDKPQVTADVGAVLNNPEQVGKVVNEINRHLKSGNVEEAVKGFLGGDSKAGAKARGLLNQFLKPGAQ